MTRGDELTLAGLAIPAGHRIVSLATRPDLRRPVNAFNNAAWPEFMLQDPISDAHWHHLVEDYARHQLMLVDDDDVIVAASNSAPLAWDGTEDDLPSGWDDQFLRTVAGLTGGVAPNTLGAIQIVVDPAHQGSGLAGVMLGAMRAQARAVGYRGVIACVRPTWKDRYPLVPIERYATWRRDDRLPFDPWIRLHERLGGRISRAEPRSMTIPGSVAAWESWTGMAFPDSGDYVVPRAAALVSIDRERDTGIYHDPNVWMVHDLMNGGPPRPIHLDERRIHGWQG